MGKVVGEFDRPDPAALRDLARLYIRFGFGAEAEALSPASTPTSPNARCSSTSRAPSRAARSRPPARWRSKPSAPARMRSGWRSAGVAPAFHDADQFAAVQAAFAELPPDLRALLGPALDRPPARRRPRGGGRG